MGQGLPSSLPLTVFCHTALLGGVPKPPSWSRPGGADAQTWDSGAIAIRKRRSPWRVVRLGWGLRSRGQKHGGLTGPSSGLVPWGLGWGHTDRGLEP